MEKNMNIRIKTTCLSFIIAIALLASTLTNADELTSLWEVNNFDQPESVAVNSTENVIYLSNINGQPTELNGKGYISKLDINGKILDKHWLNNLDAPKGIAVHGDNLYIADMQQVHQVSISQARIVKQFKVKEAKMLNDITISDDGTVYISDLLGGGVYRITDNKISLWFEHADLSHTNGLLWQEGEILIATWGLGLNDDFTTETAGSIYTVNIKKPVLVKVKGAKQLGNLDGLVKYKNAMYVSDWITGALVKIEGGKSSKILTLKPGLADIGRVGSILITPSMHDGNLTAWKM
jgi:hypothetical protein